MDPIRLEDFQNIQLYIPNDEYESDDPFAEQIELKAKAPKLAQLRGRPKKRRIRKATEGRPKKQLRCGHCKELGHNRRGCRNGRREPEVVVISSDETNSEEASSIEEAMIEEASSSEAGSSEEASSEEASSEEASSDEDKDELA
jgi:hypothetical protein